MSTYLFNIMINTFEQLDEFRKKAGIKSEAHIIPMLAEKQERISVEMAKIIAPEQFAALTSPLP